MTIIIPVPITWVAGTVVTAAQLNSNLRDATSFLLNPPRCLLGRALSPQSITSSVTTNAQYDTTYSDPYGMSNIAVNNDRINILVNGTYRCTSNFFWNANSTGNRQITLQQNATILGGDFATASSGFVGTIVTMDVELLAGDVMSFNVFQTSGSTITNLGGYPIRFSVVMVSPT